jgi:hypothetical protein
MNIRNSRFVQFIKSHKVLVSAFLIVILIAFGIGLPLSVSDGTERFDGPQKAAAQGAIRYTAQTNDGIDRISNFFINAYVKEVRRNTLTLDQCWDKAAILEDPSRTEYYEVVVGYRTWFGINYATVTLHGCQRI